MDNIRRWADGTDYKAVAAKPTAAAGASIEWAADNGVTFDHGKTEAAIFRRGSQHPQLWERFVPTSSHSTRKRRGGWEYGMTTSSRSRTTLLEKLLAAGRTAL